MYKYPKGIYTYDARQSTDIATSSESMVPCNCSLASVMAIFALCKSGFDCAMYAKGVAGIPSALLRAIGPEWALHRQRNMRKKAIQAAAT